MAKERNVKVFMRGLSLFSGNGGIDLALEGYVRTIGYCEQDRYAQHLLASRMAEGLLPCAPIYPDVKKLKGEQGYCNIIYGGFPCQDISTANQFGKGLEGKRSGLFYQIVRLAKEISPSFVFLENVPAIRTKGLYKVIEEFSSLGYDCRWTVLSAKEVGAYHTRKRWFLLAHSDSEGLQRQRSRTISNEKRQPRPSGAHENMEIKKATNSWKTEPSVDRMVDGTSFRLDRIKSLGNGVVPLQVRTAFERLIGLEYRRKL